jgi:hypothetical protein
MDPARYQLMVERWQEFNLANGGSASNNLNLDTQLINTYHSDQDWAKEFKIMGLGDMVISVASSTSSSSSSSTTSSGEATASTQTDAACMSSPGVLCNSTALATGTIALGGQTATSTSSSSASGENQTDSDENVVTIRFP